MSDAELFEQLRLIDEATKKRDAEADKAEQDKINALGDKYALTNKNEAAAAKKIAEA